MKEGSAKKFVQFLKDNRDLVYTIDTFKLGESVDGEKAYSFNGLLCLFAGSDKISYKSVLHYDSIEVVDERLKSIMEEASRQPDAVKNQFFEYRIEEEGIELTFDKTIIKKSNDISTMYCDGICDIPPIVVSRCNLKQKPTSYSFGTSTVTMFDFIIDGQDIDELICQRSFDEKETYIDTIINIVEEHYKIL